MNDLCDSKNCKSPILFLIFNRPELTARVFETIRRARPERLYIASDGPRSDHPGELQKVKETRKIATDVDWPCEIKTLYRNENLGCGRAVSEGITWFFEQEEEGIILEDDILVHPSWFRFVDKMLEKYRSHEQIMCITALSYGLPLNDASSYTFSIYNHCWGWASWRRAWRHYDHEMKKWPGLRDISWLSKLVTYNPAFRIYWNDIFDRTFRGQIDSWAYRWAFCTWAAKGISIHPAVNMMENIGYGVDATHTKSGKPPELPPCAEIQFPLRHPLTIKRNIEWDRWGSKHMFAINWVTYIKSILNKIK